MWLGPVLRPGRRAAELKKIVHLLRNLGIGLRKIPWKG